MTTHRLHEQHQRQFDAYRFVYPVLSRRSYGISMGVNLNPDKICNFDCIYCQVDRTMQSETRFVDTEELVSELDEMLTLTTSGKLYETAKFLDTPMEQRRLNDIAFSGDGEPTTYQNFDEIIGRCAELKRRHKLDDVKLILITNASMFHRPHVERGLEILDNNHGEIWAKLEAGTNDFYQLVERTPIPFRQVLDNINRAACIRPLVIQALFMRIYDQPPPASEQEAFCDRLSEILAAGGRLSRVQIYTVARRPAEDFVHPLQDHEVDALVDLVRRRTGLMVEGFYGRAAER